MPRKTNSQPQSLGVGLPIGQVVEAEDEGIRTDDEKKKKCERCGFSPAFVYSDEDIVPRSVRFCQSCFDQYVWARRLTPTVYDQDPNAFLKGFLMGEIQGIPDDPDFLRRYRLRILSRMQKTWVRKRVSLQRSFVSRSSILYTAMGKDQSDRLVKLTAKLFDSERSLLLAEIRQLLKDEPMWTDFFKKIEGVGEATAAYIIGEIGAQQTLLCPNHKRPKPVTACGCVEWGSMDYHRTVLFDATRVQAFGIQAFPSSSDLKGYFGLGLIDLSKHANTKLDGPFFVANRIQRESQVNVQRSRLSLVLQDLAGSILKQNGPWRVFYDRKKERVLRSWWAKYGDTPPPVCTLCWQSKCERCLKKFGRNEHNEVVYAGEWEPGPQRKNGYPHWVCTHGGHHFGRKQSVHDTALRALASKVLDSLYHFWRHVELGEEPIRDPEVREFIGL